MPWPVLWEPVTDLRVFRSLGFPSQEAHALSLTSKGLKVSLHLPPVVAERRLRNPNDKMGSSCDRKRKLDKGRIRDAVTNLRSSITQANEATETNRAEDWGRGHVGCLTKRLFDIQPRERDRQTHRKTEKNRQTDTSTHRKTERHTKRQTQADRGRECVRKAEIKRPRQIDRDTHRVRGEGREGGEGKEGEGEREREEECKHA